MLGTLSGAARWIWPAALTENLVKCVTQAFRS
jgi:hypothetical protein